MDILVNAVIIGFGAILVGVVIALAGLLLKIKFIEKLASVLLVCGMILAFGSLGISYATSTNKTAPTENIPAVSVDVMVVAYRTNAARARETYGDNIYKVTATITNIDKAGIREAYRGYNVDLITEDNFRLTANFANKWKSDIIKLKVGDSLTFIGKCIAPELWYNCKIVR